VQDQIEPVYGADETASDKHENLFNDMRRPERGEAESEAEKDNDTPWQFVQ